MGRGSLREPTIREPGRVASDVATAQAIVATASPAYLKAAAALYPPPPAARTATSYSTPTWLMVGGKWPASRRMVSAGGLSWASVHQPETNGLYPKINVV